MANLETALRESVVARCVAVIRHAKPERGPKGLQRLHRRGWLKKLGGAQADRAMAAFKAMRRGLPPSGPRMRAVADGRAKNLVEESMVPFAIAGVQIHVPAMKSNIETVIHKLDITMARFPWVQMVLFSELALCGPVPKDPVTLPGEAEHALQAAAARHGIGATKRQEVR